MSIRTERVSALLKSDISQILQMDYQQQAMLTITSVRVSPDLMQAHIYLSIFDPEEESDHYIELIREKTPEIRKKLAERIRHQVRRIPELHFHLDDTASYVEKMDLLFKKIKKEHPSGQNSGTESKNFSGDPSSTEPEPGE